MLCSWGPDLADQLHRIQRLVDRPAINSFGIPPVAAVVAVVASLSLECLILILAFAHRSIFFEQGGLCRCRVVLTRRMVASRCRIEGNVCFDNSVTHLFNSSIASIAIEFAKFTLYIFFWPLLAIH